MASETRTISIRPGAVEKLMMQEHSLYPMSYPPKLPMYACLNDNVARLREEVIDNVCCFGWF